MSDQSSRPALGQSVAIGTFYDAKRDCFLGNSLLVGEVPAAALSQTTIQNVDIQVSHGESYVEKIKAMNVGPDLAASLLSGLTQPEGLAHHLVDKNESGRRLQSAIHHTVTTNQVQLVLTNQDLKSCVSSMTLRTSEITHIVAGIDYGAQTILVFKHWLQRDNNLSQEEGRFRQRVDAFQEMIKNPNSNTLGRANEDFDHITAYSTALNSGDIVLNDNVEARTFIELIPAQIRGEPGGKGKPILYKLLPIQMLAYFQLGTIEKDSTPTAPSQECMRKFVELCDEFRISKQPLEDYEVFATKYSFCLPPNHIEDVAQRVRSIQTAEQELKNDFARILQQVRRGVTEPERLWQLVNGSSEGSRSPKALSTFTDDYQGKVAFVDTMMTKGAVYIGYNGIDLRRQLAQRGDIEAFVLYFSEAARQDHATWNANQTMMLNLLESRTQNSFFAFVDCDAGGDSLERAYITQYQHGEIKVQDMLEEHQYLADHCFARCQPQTLETKDIQKPLQRRFVKIPCPGFSCGSGNICDWKCFQCRDPLEYGYSDQYIYCDCGRSLYSNFDFKCNVDTHGPGFERYDNARLMSFLKSLDQSDYLNVLILGETGVGKSTFINAFVNYLYFNTLDEALNSEELQWVIPCSFATQTMDRNNIDSDIVETKISVGARDDEKDGSKGASATQRTQVYPITVGTVTYRLIDTPGIGDTRGLEYDKSNMADILATVSGYDELHGILILLKSNNARLTAHFSFCVKELLMHLHRDATENVVFGFTNTRISNYMPGDTFGSLKALLEERRDIGLTLSTKVAYCFDSESFRYLAAYKNNVILDNKPEFESSWNKSRTEAERMLEFFRTRKPHPIKNTISLNGTRNLITELTKPMAEISQLIKTNIALLEDDVRLLSDARLSGDKLRAKLHPEKQLLRTKALPKPRTVCADNACIIYKDDGSGTMLNDYPKPCHPECYLQGVAVDVRAHPQLTGCAAFRGNENCQRCGHHWTMHLHILYELESYTQKVKDVGIEEQMKKHANDITLKQSAISGRQNLMKEWEQEHEEIRQAAAKFGLWMKANSILPYNDATLAYLEILISEEQAKVDAGGIENRKRLKQLKEDEKKHIELVAILKQSMEASGKKAPIKQNEVSGLVQKLFNLKHFGKTLEKLKLDITQTHERTNRELPHRVKVKYMNKQGQRTVYTIPYGAPKPVQSPPQYQTRTPIHVYQHNNHNNHQHHHPHPQQHQQPQYHPPSQQRPGFASGSMRPNPPSQALQLSDSQGIRIPGDFTSYYEPTSQYPPENMNPYNIQQMPRTSGTQKKRSSIFSSMNPFSR